MKEQLIQGFSPSRYESKNDGHFSMIMFIPMFSKRPYDGTYLFGGIILSVNKYNPVDPHEWKRDF